MAFNAPNTARDEFLSFRLGTGEYAIDILQVQEIRAHEPVTRIANAPTFIKGVINLRGQIVPIVDLRMKFGFANAVDPFTPPLILNPPSPLPPILPAPPPHLVPPLP